MGKVEKLEREGGNLHITVSCDFTPELKVDQSVSHNGVCLTVVSIEGDRYRTTAIAETLEKTNLEQLSVGDPVNLERGMKLGARLDGHIVQGHVDQTAVCTSVEQQDGSWIYSFAYDPKRKNLTIEKGSITVDGVSLTVVDSQRDRFSVAIIPYTHEHTCFHTYREGSTVNLEFDVVGKYVARLVELRDL